MIQFNFLNLITHLRLRWWDEKFTVKIKWWRKRQKMEQQRKLTRLHVFFNLIYFSFSILKKDFYFIEENMLITFH